MNLQQLIDMTRYRLGNYEKPYFWVDSELVLYANEIINELCREAYVLEDSTSTATSLFLSEDTYDYSLHSSVIYVRSARLVSKELLTLDVAPSTAWSAGDTITGASSTSTCKVVSYETDYTYIIEERTGAFTDGESLSNGTYAADQGTGYPTLADDSTHELSKSGKIEMDTRIPGWRAHDSGVPYLYLLDHNTGYFTVYPKPDKSYVVKLSVYRYPLSDMTTTTMSGQTPEISSRYHNIVIDGICSLAYLKSGENTYFPQKANTHLALFKKATSDIKRKTNLFTAHNSYAFDNRGFI